MIIRPNPKHHPIVNAQQPTRFTCKITPKSLSYVTLPNFIELFMNPTVSATIPTTQTQWTNWAKNVTCKAQVYYPESEQDVQSIVHQAAELGQTIRVVGEGHSFSPLIQTNDCIVSLTKMRGLIAVDKTAQKATAWAGTPIKVANDALFEQGFAMINLGDIDVQSLAGATATGTHGTGLAFGNVSSEIVAFSIVTADGALRHCSETENRELFEAGRISLGALGIITKMTFNIAPTYKLEYTSAPGDFEETMQQIEQLNATNRNFEYYYFPHSETLQLKISNPTEKPVQHNHIAAYLNDVFMENGALQIVCDLGTWFPKLHRFIGRNMAKAVPKKTIVDHSHKIYATIRWVRFKEMEYNIPLEHFDACMRRVKAMVETGKYEVFFPIECRFVKGDDCWLSPAYQRDSAYIAVHVPAKAPHETYFRDMEALFMEYDGRPHWGKMHTRTAENLRTTYPQWDDFLALRQQLDPKGLFLNDHLQGVFGL